MAYALLASQTLSVSTGPDQRSEAELAGMVDYGLGALKKRRAARALHCKNKRAACVDLYPPVV